MIGCLTETTTCVVAKPLVWYIAKKWVDFVEDWAKLEMGFKKPG